MYLAVCVCVCVCVHACMGMCVRMFICTCIHACVCAFLEESDILLGKVNFQYFPLSSTKIPKYQVLPRFLCSDHLRYSAWLC